MTDGVPRLRVGLNATCFNERPSGARQRFVGIYRALIARCPDIEFVIYEPDDCRVADWFAGARNVVARRTPLPSTGRIAKMLRGLAYWRGALRRDRLDLFEQFHLPLVRAPHCPTILTVHDIRPVLPDVPLPARWLNSWILRNSLRSADHVVTVSETMLREILSFEPSLSISTVYNGIEKASFDQSSLERAAATGAIFDLRQEFALSVGHLEHRKNYISLIRAMAKLRDEGRTVSLVIVGNEGDAEDAIRQEVWRLGLSERIKILRGVSDSELADLYALSKLVVFPSSYEGFGIPILEAMAAHRPIVLSDIPVFRELTENEAVYFPPQEPAMIAGAIAEMLSNPDHRQRVVEYGDRRVAAFGFQELAAQVEGIYRSLAKAEAEARA